MRCLTKSPILRRAESAASTTVISSCTVDAGRGQWPLELCVGFHLAKKSGSLCGAPCCMP